MRILVAGGSGRLGRSLLDAAGPAAVELAGEERASCSPEAILDRHRPSIVVNAAALSSVAACSASPSAAFCANAAWPAGLARSCRQSGVRLVHISTDLVYSGGNAPYAEWSAAVPLSVYGWSKLMGDILVARINPDALIVRTSVLFGTPGASRKTFSEELLSGSVAVAYADCWRNHTSIRWLAETLLRLSAMDAAGLLMVCSGESHSRSAFAEILLRAHGRKDMPRPGYRPAGIPADLTLLPEKAELLLGEKMPGLEQSMAFEMPFRGQASSMPRYFPV
jgi:dTDP-4-dehydrorhamnose reductase